MQFHLMWRRSAALTAMLAASLVSAPAAAAQDGQSRVLEVLERTKTTRVTYALYMWNRVMPADQAPREEWSAEFHSGDLHRVETPLARAVADCAAGTGTAFFVDSGEYVEGPQVARSACGINTNIVFQSAEWVGEVRTRFGVADRVRIVDEQNVRHYDVSRDGILLGSTYAENAPGERLQLSTVATAVLRTLPEPDMFDRDSLARSFVAEVYRQPPQP